MVNSILHKTTNKMEEDKKNAQIVDPALASQDPALASQAPDFGFVDQHMNQPR